MEKNFRLYQQNETEPFFINQLHTLSQGEKEEYFTTYLSFGTGGMRGKIGCGTNRINSYMVRRLSLAIALYIKEKNDQAIKTTPTVVIAFDSRNFSSQFALQAALVFATKGIRVLLFKQARGVPLLSFAVRYFKATMGVLITASHNPPAYNGYKLFNNQGAQIVEPVDTEIMQIMANLKTLPVSISLSKAEASQLLSFIGEEMDEYYGQAMQPLITRPQLIHKEGGKFTITYSALHGTGGAVIPKLLDKYGFKVLCVKEQQSLDGNFPTVESPNPEEAEALTMAIALAKKMLSPLVLATDPDADRLGVAVLHNNQYVRLNGNQMGSLVLNYRCISLLEQGIAIAGSSFINTVVSSPLQNQIAKFYGLHNSSVLTGFKNIACKMQEQEALGIPFLFACEESYGLLLTDKVRDKDAISAALVLAEMALYYFNKGLSLIDALAGLYKQFGYFADDGLSYTFEGQRGQQVITTLMTKLRQLNSTQLNPLLSYKIDYLSDATGLKATNALAFTDGGFNKIMVRPSGTEPKIKFYLLSYSPNSNHEATARLGEFKTAMHTLIKKFSKG